MSALDLNPYGGTGYGPGTQSYYDVPILDGLQNAPTTTSLGVDVTSPVLAPDFQSFVAQNDATTSFPPPVAPGFAKGLVNIAAAAPSFVAGLGAALGRPIYNGIGQYGQDIGSVLSSVGRALGNIGSFRPPTAAESYAAGQAAPGFLQTLLGKIPGQVGGILSAKPTSQTTAQTTPNPQGSPSTGVSPILILGIAGVALVAFFLSRRRR